ncbi:MAG: carboxymuconolactone decarboxylase family protein [Myxococcota bacterium]
MTASTPLADVEWEACPVQPRRDPELESYLRGRIGVVPEVARYFSHCPWVGRGLADSFFQMGILAPMDPSVAERVMLVVSQDASCRYCYAAQRALLRIQGYPAARIGELEQDLHSAQLEPPVRLALEFARRISRARPLPGPPEIEALRDAGYSEYAVCELAAVAAFSVLANRNATLLADEGLPRETIENLLRHLHSDELDPVELDLAQIARESVWYRPAQVQRRTQALARQLSGAARVEAVGSAGLANAIARLDLLVDMGE